MEKVYCQGCGALIQSTNPDEVGYTPKSTLNKESVLCKRCFRLKHYNEIQDVSMTDDDFLTMVSQIRDTDGLVVHVIDIFDVNGSMIKSLPRIIGNKSILLVGNKIDLLPKSTNKRKLTQWLQATANEAGIKVEGIYLISSVRGYGLAELTEAIEKYRNKNDVYTATVPIATTATAIATTSREPHCSGHSQKLEDVSPVFLFDFFVLLTVWSVLIG